MLALAPCLVPFLLLAHFSGASSVYFSNVLRQESCPVAENEDWGYGDSNGPDTWGESYPDCNGMEQSPIAINRSTVVSDPNLAKLQMNGYDVPISNARVENNGHTIQITPVDDVQRTIEVAGSTYYFLQAHMHWGDGSGRGSEHVIDNCASPMEIHFVHRNEEDQLAVVGVMVREKRGRRRGGNNEEMQKIVDVLSEVRYRHNSTELNLNLDLTGLLPKNPDAFYRYNGSLTTPGCTEGVIWSLLTRPIHACKSQLAAFRDVYSVAKEDASDGCKLVNNFRCPQPLNDRIVYKSKEA